MLSRRVIGACVAAVVVVGLIGVVSLGNHDGILSHMSRSLTAYHLAGSDEPIHLVNYQAHLYRVSPG